MPPLKGGRFDIHFHRRDAEHVEDLFNFLLSAETRLTRLSESDGRQGAESKNQPPLGGFNWLLSIRYPHKCFVCLSKLKAFPLPEAYH